MQLFAARHVTTHSCQITSRSGGGGSSVRRVRRLPCASSVGMLPAPSPASPAPAALSIACQSSPGLASPDSGSRATSTGALLRRRASSCSARLASLRVCACVFAFHRVSAIKRGTRASITVFIQVIPGGRRKLDPNGLQLASPLLLRRCRTLCFSSVTRGLHSGALTTSSLFLVSMLVPCAASRMAACLMGLHRCDSGGGSLWRRRHYANATAVQLTTYNQIDI